MKQRQAERRNFFTLSIKYALQAVSEKQKNGSFWNSVERTTNVEERKKRQGGYPSIHNTLKSNMLTLQKGEDRRRED